MTEKPLSTSAHLPSTRGGQDARSPSSGHVDSADTTTLLAQTQAFFSSQGILARADAHYRVRPGQQAMAEAVAQTITTSGALVVEAGTGTGKTWAYLVPALLSGGRVLVSTATKALQDQLFNRDLPHLCALLGAPVKLALLKGRASYVCWYRLEQALYGEAGVPAHMQHTLARIERFARGSDSGDLGELSGLDERSPAIALATSTRDNCLGSQCADFKRCFVHQARREALAADVTVINHHLFFADLAVRESGMAELLPSVHTVVFDEAHQLNEIGVQFMGSQFSSSHMIDFGRDVLTAGINHARGMADWLEVGQALEQAGRDLRLLGAAWPQGTRLLWHGLLPQDIDESDWQRVQQALRQSIDAALVALEGVSEHAQDFVRLIERGQSLLQRLQHFVQPVGADEVRWVDIGVALRLVQSPLDIADTVRQRLLGQREATSSMANTDHVDDESSAQALSAADTTDTTMQAAPSARSWIFTSATLGDDAALSWFTQPCGLHDARTLRVPSPFDYASRAALYVPDVTDMPAPGDPAHAAAVAELAARTARVLGGRTLVLTTTLRSLKQIGEALQQAWQDEADAPAVLIQGEKTKQELITEFRAGGSSDAAPDAPAHGCVLVASASFWEGIDVPGDALQLVIIDKLPFPPPTDPLVQARCNRLQQQGKNPFRYYHLPETAVTLKQGAGRLIRHESDAGILIICDNRLRQKGYGIRLLDALPPMQTLPDEAALQQWLDALVALRRAAG